MTTDTMPPRLVLVLSRAVVALAILASLSSVAALGYIISKFFKL